MRGWSSPMTTLQHMLKSFFFVFFWSGLSLRPLQQLDKKIETQAISTKLSLASKILK
jgi:hypothetical protein